MKLAEILAVAREDVEGVEHDLIVMLSGVQSVEIRDAVNTEQHGLALDDERTIPVAQRIFRDQRKPIAPVVAIAGKQANALPVPLDDQSIAIMFDLVDPIVPGRNRGARVGMQGSNAVCACGLDRPSGAECEVSLLPGELVACHARTAARRLLNGKRSQLSQSWDRQPFGGLGG